MTTTSPAPQAIGSVNYPSLMSHHQMTQGYRPSLQSMFNHNAVPQGDSSLLFGSQPKTSSLSSLYQHSLPRPSMPAPPPGPSSYNQQQFGAPASSYYAPRSHPGPSYPPPPPPAPSYPPARAHSPEHSPSRDPVNRDLKQVSLPRDCLPRFLSIAAVNTARNRETCGLLLGKDRGRKFVVTTLLIPKQRSTSDTCAMEEEELVLQFTEERALITLGWIHTHPTQSCFMSSVDLHTHCGFQRMLPESFAVVCAPQHTPK
jgi:STAM-binding protein